MHRPHRYWRPLIAPQQGAAGLGSAPPARFLRREDAHPIIGSGSNDISGVAILVVAILLASFSMAPVDALDLPIGIVKLFSEGLAWFLLFWSLRARLRAGRPLALRWELILPLILLGGVGAAGSLIYGEGLMGGLLFLRVSLMFLPLLVALQNVDLNDRSRRFVCVTLAILFLLQLPVSWLKAGFVGVDESHWIGTVHNQAGELGLLLPLFAVSALTSWFLFLRLPRVIFLGALLLMVGFGMFGIIAEKRAVVYLLPLWLGLAFFLYLAWILRRRNSSLSIRIASMKRLLAQGASLGAVAFILVWGSLVLIPSLNPEERVGGSVSFEHLTNYTTDYLLRGYQHPLNNSVENVEQDRGIQMGRLRVTLEALRLTATSDLRHALFGFGGSATSPSYQLGAGRNDVMFEKFGIRGAASGVTRVVLESGYVGLFLMLGWFVWLWVDLFFLFWRADDVQTASGSMAILLIHGVFAFDFIVYSNASWTCGVLGPVYFVLLALHLQKSLTPRDFGVQRFVFRP